MTTTCWLFTVKAAYGEASLNQILQVCVFARPSTARRSELALSYFESYYNLRGERTLRSYSGPVNLARLDSQHWMTSEEDVWCVPELLIAARHYALFPDKVARALPRLDRRSFEAGMHGWTKH